MSTIGLIPRRLRRGGFIIHQLADVLAELIVLVGLENASFLANSIGCQVVVDLAVRYPVLVKKLIEYLLFMFMN